MRALHLPLILGSSSPFRRELLERLQLTFQCHSPDIDEQRLEDESADTLVLRLASAKADAVAEQFPPAFIIGSDQVAMTTTGTILAAESATRAGLEAHLAKLPGVKSVHLDRTTGVAHLSYDRAVTT